MARSYVAEARRRVGPKRERIRPVIERLAAEHPDATIALRFRSELELLVSVMLSAQTTDVNVNRVTERLFQKSLESSPEPAVRTWVEVYLGRLADAAGERAEAVNHYKQALAVEGGSAAARQAAEKGIEQSFQK